MDEDKPGILQRIQKTFRLVTSPLQINAFSRGMGVYRSTRVLTNIFSIYFEVRWGVVVERVSIDL